MVELPNNSLPLMERLSEHLGTAHLNESDAAVEIERLRNDWPYDHLPHTEAGEIILPRTTFCNSDGDSLVVSAIRWDHDGWTVTNTEGEEYSPDQLYDEEAAEAAAEGNRG